MRSPILVVRTPAGQGRSNRLGQQDRSHGQGYHGARRATLSAHKLRRLGGDGRQDRFAFRGRTAFGEDGEDQGPSAGQLHIGGVMTSVAGIGIARPTGVAGLGPDPSPGGQTGGEIASNLGERIGDELGIL